MVVIPHAVVCVYQEAVARDDIPVEQRAHYVRWLRYFLDFCHKYHHDPAASESFLPFEAKLIEKHQADWMRQQARRAVALYHRLCKNGSLQGDNLAAGTSSANRPEPSQGHIPQGSVTNTNGVLADTSDLRRVAPRGGGTQETNRRADTNRSSPTAPPRAARSHSGFDTIPAQPSGTDPVSAHPIPVSDPISSTRPLNRSYQRDVKATSTGATPSPMAPHDHTSTQEANSSWVWVFDGLKSAIAVRHYSQKTYHAYRYWVQRLQTFVRSKDPALLNMEDVKAFLSDLATRRKVAASSQNQAFNALLFLFRHILEKPFENVEGVVRAKRRRYIPVVLSRDEVERVFGYLSHPYDLIAKLLYGWRAGDATLFQ